MNLPADPNILLSYVNMHLRDDNTSLDDFCAERDADINELISTLEAAGYVYDEHTNSFKKELK